MVIIINFNPNAKNIINYITTIVTINIITITAIIIIAIIATIINALFLIILSIIFTTIIIFYIVINQFNFINFDRYYHRMTFINYSYQFIHHLVIINVSANYHLFYHPYHLFNQIK